MSDIEVIQILNQIKTQGRGTGFVSSHLKSQVRSITRGSSSEVKMKMVRLDPELISEVDDPTPEMQVIAVTAKAGVFRYLKNPCKEAIDITILKNPLMIAQSEHVNTIDLERAVDSNGFIIKDIKHPTEKMQISAVNQNGALIRYCMSPSADVQMRAVIYDESNIIYIRHPVRSVVKYVLAKDYKLISAIKNSIDEELAFEVICKDHKVFDSIPMSCMSERILKEALSKNGLYIRNVNFPSDELQEIAVRQNPKALEFIRNPCDKLKLMTI